jgi:hypothetical protein
MMVVPVKVNPTFVAEEPRRLFSMGTTLANSSVVPYYDLSPDDSRFIMLRMGGGDQNPGGGQLVVVEHWLQEMRAKVDEGQR